MSAAAGVEAFEPDPRRWRALGVCLVAGFMSLLDVSIINVAIPSIRDSLSASASSLEWIVAGYALALGLLLVPAGRLGDARGRRTVFIVGLALFTLASAACGLAQSASWLVAMRLLQGMAAGLFQPQIPALIQAEFRGHERRTAFGAFGAVVGLSTAVGPVAGGLIIAWFGPDAGWRAIFMVNAPIGLLAIVLALRLLPRSAPVGRRQSLDPVGVGLLGAGVLLLLLPLVEGQQYGWPWWCWASMAASVPVLVAFAWWERLHRLRGREPVADLGLFRVRSYASGSALAAVYFAGFTGIFFVLTLFLQLGHGYSALLAGVATTPFAAGSTLTSAVSARVTARIGPRVVVVGLSLVLVGLFGVELASTLVTGPAVGWALALPLLVSGLGSGLVIAPNQDLTLSQVPPLQGGSAAAVLQTGQRVGSALGLAVLGTLFFNGLGVDGDFAKGLDMAVWASIVAVGAALVLSLVDRRAPSSSH